MGKSFASYDMKRKSKKYQPILHKHMNSFKAENGMIKVKQVQHGRKQKQVKYHQH